MESEKSDSGFIEPTSPDETSGHFSGYVEIPSDGFNCLYKAKRNGRLYVLKGLKAELRDKPAYKELLKKEFDISVQFNHPNIVSVHSFEQDPVAGSCIVMDCIAGQTLREFLKTKPDKATRLRIVKEMLTAMSHYHSLQVIHRDLKPDNILITNNGNHVKLIDFGLGDTDFHTVLKQPAGSDKYAAPEQKDLSVTIDCRADIYAFGKILQQIFPNKYGKIADKCTKENREERYSSAEDIANAIDKSDKTRTVAIIIPIVLALALAMFLFIPRDNTTPTNTDLETSYTEETPIENGTQAVQDETKEESVATTSASHSNAEESNHTEETQIKNDTQAVQDETKEKSDATPAASHSNAEDSDAILTEKCNELKKIYEDERKSLDSVLQTGLNGKYRDLVTFHYFGIMSRAHSKAQAIDISSLSLTQKAAYNTFWSEIAKEWLEQTDKIMEGLPSYAEHKADSLKKVLSDDDAFEETKKIYDSVRLISKKYKK